MLQDRIEFFCFVVVYLKKINYGKFVKSETSYTASLQIYYTSLRLSWNSLSFSASLLLPFSKIWKILNQSLNKNNINFFTGPQNKVNHSATTRDRAQASQNQKIQYADRHNN